ncbi:hypothetical protein NDU88_001630 [Pleurodeles waltl]|uniref:Uncharacterized protein n=1 Tax=Pleurodeles waltl TaxID=8319 RepID=A0AAV7KZ38_PLEWA|nr:hypothetical protein NDU88_001630 [Pleurodeles waltl]
MIGELSSRSGRAGSALESVRLDSIDEVPGGPGGCLENAGAGGGIRLGVRVLRYCVCLSWTEVEALASSRVPCSSSLPPHSPVALVPGQNGSKTCHPEFPEQARAEGGPSRGFRGAPRILRVLRVAMPLRFDAGSDDP